MSHQAVYIQGSRSGRRHVPAGRACCGELGSAESKRATEGDWGNSEGRQVRSHAPFSFTVSMHRGPASVSSQHMGHEGNTVRMSAWGQVAVQAHRGRGQGEGGRAWCTQGSPRQHTSSGSARGHRHEVWQGDGDEMGSGTHIQGRAGWRKNVKRQGRQASRGGGGATRPRVWGLGDSLNRHPFSLLAPKAGSQTPEPPSRGQCEAGKAGAACPCGHRGLGARRPGDYRG